MTDNAHFDHNPKTDYTTPVLTPQHAGYAEEDFSKPDTMSENARRFEESEKKRTDGMHEFYSIAQKWATLPNLTATERCHGVAHDLYLKHGVEDGADGDGNAVKFNRGDDYCRYFDHQFADLIRMRTIRSAKELFGG